MNLANPAWLIAWVVLPILAILAVLLARFKGQPWERLAAERLRGRLIKNDHPLPRWLALGFLLAAMAIFIFALARPQGDAGVKTEKTEGRNVMIALDLSRSMRVTDVNPDRLGQGKILIYEILEVLKKDRVSLVGFAGTPYLFAPLTIDHGALKETVEQIDEQWVTMGGSDISAAIKLATATLKETGQNNNLLILISDGEENEGDLDAIIADAESAGVRIFSIGVGTEDGGFVPHDEFSGGYLLNESGNKVLSRLQPDVLKKLATSTGGRYVVAGSAGDIPALIEVAVQGMDFFEMEAGETKILIEFFQWAVLPGILFLMAAIIAGTRWSRVSMAVILLSWCIYPADLQAKDIRGAKTAFAEGRFNEARDTYRSLANEKEGNTAAKFRLGEGLSAYEALDLRGARSAYSEALLSTDDQVVSEAHEGLGNTLFQMGWLGISGSRYPKGKAVPDMEKFDELVREQLQKMSEEKVPEKGDTNGFIRLEAVIVNWTDAVRHYRSALEKNPKDEKPLKNSEMTMAYLKRLAELLEEEKQQTAEEMMQQQQQQGEGEPKDGEGEPKDKKEGSEGEPGEEGEGEKPEGKEKSEDKGDKGEKGDKPEEGEEGDKPEESDADPNESPEEEARRKLKENSDIEKGPLSSGRRQHRIPKKDW
ncbi:MAG: vWA domain-containing protein [Akkermansiaceae bacterium]|jgi:Ca-activated chloride channel family protein